MKYLQLIRWKNLIILAYILYVIKYAFINILDIPSALNNFQYALFTLSIILITASGYVINDIEDVAIDKINKPEKLIISKYINDDLAFNVYFGINAIGLALGFYISYAINKVNFAFIFVLASILLYQYAINLKKVFIANNFIIAVLSGLSIFMVALFDIFPMLDSDNVILISQAFKIILIVSGFAFITTLIREIIKDAEDVVGDKKFGVKTLPIILGISTTKNIVFALTLIPISAILYFIFNFIIDQTIPLTYLLIFVVLPLIYFEYKLVKAQNKKDFTELSTIIKAVMFTGISVILIFTLTLKLNHAI
ncbi:MAG: geranylgeranylglycerol-phosphate geranylgeranyltransferase [Ichthyobacteriaceae bacterium]|nr:geranylgeranylglycerol-phosphate geranylgeranyltransferase [Ichthyobacteriaceae bacterium]